VRLRQLLYRIEGYFHMIEQAFVHLRAHSEYSVSDSILRVDEAVAAAAESAQPALALTDIANMFGAVKFYKACRRKGIQPILGAEVQTVVLVGKNEVRGSILLLVTDRSGYLNLCTILSVAWANVAVDGTGGAVVPYDVVAKHSAGLLLLSGGQNGILGLAVSSGEEELAQKIALRIVEDFRGSFYLEVQRYESDGEERYNGSIALLAQDLGLPIVATHPIQFLKRSDFDAHEARACISNGEILADPRRTRRFTPDQYFKSSAEMQEAFADLPDALMASSEIARRCRLELVLGKPQLPDFPTPLLADGSAMPMGDFFRTSSIDGLERRLEMLFPDTAQRERARPEYMDRLEFEINTILKMGFPGYFLIVSDFINWAKHNSCPVGPGRGSGAGSLVAYALNITDLDPIKFKLLFERFLNPERVSMPDFDIDFCQSNRENVIEYVKGRYGRDAVSQIATFGTMAAKAAIRDVGRVLGMGYGYVDSIAKLIPAPPGKTVTLAVVPDEPDSGVVYARKEAPELEAREAREEEVAGLLLLATRVEGIVRNVGTHAGGVLIAPGKITDFCPLYQQAGSTSVVSQFDKDDVEAIGLVKFDFLGLATLTILELAKNFIVRRKPELETVLYEGLTFDDRRVYELFASGATEAVFQFESGGMQRMLKDAKPSRLEDLIALNALFRPGPMDLIPSFVARKHGREPVEYPHPLVEAVLAETYGIMIYQEQVMQVAQVLGGYSLGGADLLRRAMGKKKAEEMAQHRHTFREGAAAKGIPGDKADEIFDLMEKFAGYGFNKSHAAAYSVLAYHTAWVKVHFPAEFYAANMTVEMGDTDKLKVLRQDAAKFGVAFDIPSINRGKYKFDPTPDMRVVYGLGAVKGTGEGAVEAIVAAREQGGEFRSLFDFCCRVDKSKVNKRVVEALIKAGAFDECHPLGMDGRSQLLASVGIAFEYADAQQRNLLQGGLFDSDDQIGSMTLDPAYTDAAIWDVQQRLDFEKVAIGSFLSGHLFDQSREEVRRFISTEIANLVDSRETLQIAGIVADLRIVNGQRGRAAIFTLDDKSGGIEAVAAEEVLNRHLDLLVDDNLLICTGRVQKDRFNGGLRFNVQDVTTLANARVEFGRHVQLQGVVTADAVLGWLRSFGLPLDETGEVGKPAGLPVRVSLSLAGAQCVMDLGHHNRVSPTDAALTAWKAHGGHAAIVYQADTV
jgi:DNA polymerase-3 subunit alpha